MGEFTWAQKTNGSPYSRFGLGDLTKKGTARNAAIGGTGIALRNNSSLNAKNPASYTTLDSTSFILDIGGFAEMGHLSSETKKDDYYKANFDYISLGFSVKKWWAMALGIQKLSNIGYSLDFAFDISKLGNFKTKYTGNGGLNKAYWTNAFKLGNLSIGINANYNWGNILTERTVSFETGKGLPYSSTEKLAVSNFNYDFGLQYEATLNKDYTLVTGATFGNKTDITGKYEFISSVSGKTIKEESKNEKALNIPNNFGIGIALNKSNKFIYTVDFNYSMWEDAAGLYLKNRGSAGILELKDSYRIGTGAEYIPDRLSITNYWNRVKYRFGAYYEKNYLQINGNQLKEYGVTLGLGLPIRGKSSIDVALELGTRGTTKDNLVKEQFAKLSVSISLFEIWFRKVLYN